MPRHTPVPSDGRVLVLLALLGLLSVMLACSGTPAAMRISDPPLYVCPTATPRPTDTPPPTSLPPSVYFPPSGWATSTPLPGCLWNGVVCATNTPYPGGSFLTPAFTRSGATATPRPTTTPYPTPTPFVMRPPEAFYVGDPIYAGGFTSPITARLRLINVWTTTAAPAAGSARSIVLWQIEVKNLGPSPYDVFPAYQMYVSTVRTPSGTLDGLWGASVDAVAEAGLSTVLDAVTLAPGEIRTFSLAAYIPSGTPMRFTWALDPTTRPTSATLGIPGGNLLIWTNTTNSICAGELAGPARLPTPLA